MLTIRWDTAIITAVVGLSVAYLVLQVLVRIGVARLIRSTVLARRSRAPRSRPLRATLPRGDATPSRNLTLHRDDAETARRTPPRRKAQ